MNASGSQMNRLPPIVAKLIAVVAVLSGGFFLNRLVFYINRLQFGEHPGIQDWLAVLLYLAAVSIWLFGFCWMMERSRDSREGNTPANRN